VYKGRSPFSEAEVKRLLLQLLKAVSFLHERWVMHRDLKLSNLLVREDVRISWDILRDTARYPAMFWKGQSRIWQLFIGLF
jgi:serine/threonine protein kinase